MLSSFCSRASTSGPLAPGPSPSGAFVVAVCAWVVGVVDVAARAELVVVVLGGASVAARRVDPPPLHAVRAAATSATALRALLRRVRTVPPGQGTHKYGRSPLSM